MDQLDAREVVEFFKKLSRGKEMPFYMEVLYDSLVYHCNIIRLSKCQNCHMLYFNRKALKKVLKRRNVFIANMERDIKRFGFNVVKTTTKKNPIKVFTISLIK